MAQKGVQETIWIRFIIDTGGGCDALMLVLLYLSRTGRASDLVADNDVNAQASKPQLVERGWLSYNRHVVSKIV